MSTGRKIVQGRNLRGLTAAHLATEIGASPQTVSGYESGVEPVPEGRWNSISTALSLPRSFFSQEPWEELHETAVSFRKKKQLKREVRVRVLARGELSSQTIEPIIADNFNLPSLDLPEFCGLSATEAAAALRDHWSLGRQPIQDMTALVEAKGARVFFVSEESSSVDGLSFWYGETPFMLINRHHSSGERIRMDVAHELAHLVLHRDGDAVCRDEEEKEAWQFCREFLVPSVVWKQCAPRHVDIDALLEHKSVWGVSMQALMYMSHEMGLISDYAYKVFWQVVGVNKWRKQEPGQMPVETSLIHDYVLRSAGVHSVTYKTIARLASVLPNDVAELMPTRAAANLKVLS